MRTVTLPSRNLPKNATHKINCQKPSAHVWLDRTPGRLRLLSTRLPSNVFTINTVRK